MRLGVLDVGSNAAQLQVVDAFAGGPPLPIRAVKIPTRLGEEACAEGEIGQNGQDRIVAAVQQAVEAARALNVDQLYPFVTAAIRELQQPGRRAAASSRRNRYAAAVSQR